METTQTDTIIMTATQVPVMKSGRHEQMLRDGWTVQEHTATDTTYEIESEGVWVRVDRNRNVLDFG